MEVVQYLSNDIHNEAINIELTGKKILFYNPLFDRAKEWKEDKYPNGAKSATYQNDHQWGKFRKFSSS